MLGALGCAQSNSDSSVLVVTTSYPGASAQVVADSIVVDDVPAIQKRTSTFNSGDQAVCLNSRLI
jgi:multidrug efflux pump subunit AcrB